MAKQQYLNFYGFDWDEGNYAKITSRVSLETVEKFFSQSLWVTFDTKHSTSENRWIAMGPVEGSSRFLFVAYTIRRSAENVFIRPISARYMSRKERSIYEKIKEEFENE